MAITESDYLHVHSSESTYLLLKSPSHFHLIRVDVNLTESVMNRLLRIYPCDTNQLRQLGVHFSAFKAETLRGVVIKGYQTGDMLELWLGDGVREYQLGTDYSDELLSRFFSGYSITRRLPPKWEGLDPKLIRKITWGLNGISITCSVIFYFISKPYKLWSILCILCLLSAIGITLMYPSSFTLADDSKKQYTNKGKGHLLPGCISLGASLGLRTLNDFTFRDHAFEVLLLASFVTSFVLYALYIRIHKEHRNGLVHAIVVIFATIFISLGTVGQLNYLLDFNGADRQVAEVTDKQITRYTKSTSYDCIVVFSNGESMELTLSARSYKEINIGDDVIVTHHSGAFSIPFSTVETFSDAQEME